MELTLYERLGRHEGILRLLKPFYFDVTQHEVLGPIFSSHIQDWPAHLNHITEFWARQTGGPSRYPGGFAGAHHRLGIQPGDVQHWLGLWEWNCRRQLPPVEADEMIALTRRISEQLQRILAGKSGLTIGRPERG